VDLAFDFTVLPGRTYFEHDVGAVPTPGARDEVERQVERVADGQIPAL
jgi:hypothetical protein